MSSAARHAPSDEAPWFLAPQFDTVDQQIGAGRLGMWLFVCAEVLFFSALCLSYCVVRFLHPEMIAGANEVLDKPLGLLAALVMLGAGFAAAMTVRAAKLGDGVALQRHAVFTIGAAVAFLVLLALQHRALAVAGVLPGDSWDPVGAAAGLPDHAALFFGTYLTITFVFAAHIVAGLVALLWILMRARRGEFSANNFVAVENVGLFWQVLNVAWIFIFPLLFLVK